VGWSTKIALDFDPLPMGWEATPLPPEAKFNVVLSFE
jgi:hypothetical protein